MAVLLGPVDSVQFSVRLSFLKTGATDDCPFQITKLPDPPCFHYAMISLLSALRSSLIF
jgi:hypothetical protein